ncbi:hypothetical protein ABEB36_014170 [Hypothenemus hampei]|uniref:Myb/SANT-like DNA-binding domain-containing protein n=1 Tax=Hypothenemus hampei TaxID=57062 RepID=A0ABD1E3K1_HYPHA
MMELELDSQTCKEFKGSKIINYLKSLINNKDIDFEGELQIVEWSEDCINFYPVHIEQSLKTIDCDDQIVIETASSSKASLNEESFEIVDYTDLTQDEPGIVIENTNETVSSSDSFETTAENWNTKETRLLLDKYELYLNCVGPLKKFKTKKVMWKKVSEDILSLLNINKIPYQCENRYKTIIKKMKKAIDNNKKTGTSKMEVEYEEELCKIVAKDDSILPEVLVGPGKVIKPKIGMENGSSSETNENKSKKRIRKRSVGDILLQIQKQKEEGRERRHREKLEILKELGNVLLGKSRELRTEEA